MKTPDSDSFARFIRWGIIIFIFYVLFKSVFWGSVSDNNSVKSFASHKEITETKKDCDKKIEFPFMSVNFIPELIPTVIVNDVKIGTGEPAMCGQAAKVSYEYNSKEGKPLEKGEKEITIGDGQLLQGLELGLIGVKSGGERTVTIPAELAGNLASYTQIIAKAKVDFTPFVIKSAMGLKFINDKIGTGKPVNCGDKVMANIKLWKIDGSKVFSQDNVEFTIGNSRALIGVDQAIIGMRKGGNRIVIIPPAYAKSSPNMQNQLPISVPNNEIIVAEIELFGISGASTTNKQLK